MQAYKDPYKFVRVSS